VKKLWIAIALVALLLALRFSGLGEWLSFDTLARHRLTLAGWVSGHPLLSAGAFVAIYTVVAALALPGAVWLTLGGGFLFGAVLGTALTVSGATIGATLLFLFAQRVFGADALQKLGPKAEGLARGIQANAWSYLLVLRLVPLFPFFLVNLVPAFCGIRPAVFIVTTGLGIIPGTAAATRWRSALACTGSSAPPTEVIVTLAEGLMLRAKDWVGAWAICTRAALICGLAWMLRANSPSFARQ